MVTQSNFNRDYRLTVTSGTTQKIISPPFRFAFNCNESIKGGGPNKLQGQIYGLAKDTRNMFRRDEDDDRKVFVSLDIGYDGALKNVFSGDVSTGSSRLTRNAYITQFAALDGGDDYINAYTSKTVSGKDNAINSIIEDMPSTTKGKVTATFPELSRPKVLMGASSELIEDLVGQDKDFYIKDGKVNIISEDEVTLEYVPKVSAKTGLLNTPSKQDKKVTFETVMNPYLTIGGRCDLESFVDERLNGVYKIEMIRYSGDTRGVAWKQAVTCVLLDNYKVVK